VDRISSVSQLSCIVSGSCCHIACLEPILDTSVSIDFLI
jgi:hypothetical protein